MKSSFWTSAVLYLSLGFGANAADTEMLNDLRDGDMAKLEFHKAPVNASDAVFTSPDGSEHRLSDWQGKYVLVNFWATWCAPCRAEMPMLDALQQEFGGDTFEVVTVATGPNPLPAIERFFEEKSITALPVLLDPKQALARGMGVGGLPITVILSPDGQEIARLQGEADWNSDSARAILAALIAG